MSTNADTVGRSIGGIRAVTDDEVAFFDQSGWVHLPGLLSAELAGELLAHIKSTMTARVDGGDDYVQTRAPGLLAERMIEYVASTNLRESDDWIAALACSHELAEASARLLRTRPLRLFSDSVFHKPAHGIDGLYAQPTRWHQDYPAMPMDRANGVQIWVAASEVTPDMGSLQYLTGTHRLPPLGKGEAFRAGDQPAPNGATDVYPWLLEQFEVSPAFHLQPGDALAHHCLTLHAATANASPTHDRWAWASHRFDAKVAYNGAPNHRTDDRGLQLNRTFDNPAFPLVLA